MKNSNPFYKIPLSKEKSSVNPLLDGYPIYPESEDIYLKSVKESNIDPEEPSVKKTKSSHGKQNEKSFQEDLSGSDLDVPGTELDDADEANGSEDEENNYYSLGGDNHNNLEEEKE